MDFVLTCRKTGSIPIRAGGEPAILAGSDSRPLRFAFGNESPVVPGNLRIRFTNPSRINLPADFLKQFDIPRSDRVHQENEFLIDPVFAQSLGTQSPDSFDFPNSGSRFAPALERVGQERPAFHVQFPPCLIIGVPLRSRFTNTRDFADQRFALLIPSQRRERKRIPKQTLQLKRRKFRQRIFRLARNRFRPLREFPQDLFGLIPSVAGDRRDSIIRLSTGKSV